MRRRSLFCLFAAVALSACDRVTAPRALEIADQVEQNLWRSWDPTSLGGFPIAEGFLNVWQSPGDSSTVLTSIDNGTEALDAAVIERVFIPPKGEGAPLSSRELVVWARNGSYGILAHTETHAADGTISEYDNEDDLLNPRPVLVVPHPLLDDWWIPRAGEVTIEPLNVGTSCPFNNGGSDAEADKSRRVTCDLGTYDVELEGELVRRADAKNTLLPESMKRHHRLILARQRVKGIRFTVVCHPTELILMTPIYGGCLSHPLVFWRNNALFSPSLGVDISQMTRLGGLTPATYGRTRRAGSDRVADGSHVIRWTVSQPNGVVLDHGSVTDNIGLPNDRPGLAECANGLRSDGRRQCLIPEIGYPKGTSRYRVLVLDIESAARQ